MTWFSVMIPQWMKPGLILHGYRTPSAKNLRGKLKDAKRVIKTISNSRKNQRDNSDSRDESLPIYFNAFMDYFEYVTNYTFIRA